MHALPEPIPESSFRRAVKTVLPQTLRRWLRKQQSWVAAYFPLGRLGARFAWRRQPLRRNFGLGHGLPVDRYYRRRGSLRGLHFQSTPYQEVKLVRCIRGSISDVAMDFRSDAPTYRQWVGVELTVKQGNMRYIPAGFEHGCRALEDHTEVSYLVSQFCHPEADRGIRWDDPKVGVA